MTLHSGSKIVHGVANNPNNPHETGNESSGDEGNIKMDFGEPGASYDVSATKLSAQDREVAMSWRRPGREADEIESRPLPSYLKADTFGKELSASDRHTYGEQREALCVSMNKAANIAAVGCRDGQVMIQGRNRSATAVHQIMNRLHARHNKHVFAILDVNEQMIDAKSMALMNVLDLSSGTPTAVTSIQFRDQPHANRENVALIAVGERLLHVHTTTGHVLSTVSEAGNKIHCVEMRQDCQVFATAGSDHAVRVYNEHTQQLTMKLDHGDDVHTVGHSNHVYSVAWSPDDPQVLLSGGWDKTIQVWDMRLARSVRSIYGPYLCGDALDTRGHCILTGSWRQDAPLQLWDLASGRLMTNLPFHQPEHNACLLYTAKFGRGALDGLILAGGSGSVPVVKVFKQTGELVGTLKTPSSVNSLDAMNGGKDKRAAVACEHHLLMMDLSML